MSNAAAFIVIKEGQHKIYFNKWSAELCILDLEDGPESAATATAENNEEIPDFPFSEAGYLIDFDTKSLIFYSDYLDSVLEDLELGDFDDGESPEAIQAFVSHISPQWSGWKIQTDDEDNTQIYSHLDSRKISIE